MLPYQLSVPAEDSDCCMYVEDNLLVVHLDKNILKFRAGLQLVQTSTTTTQKDVMRPHSQPVVNTVLRLYYIEHMGKCYSVNMDTGVVCRAIY